MKEANQEEERQSLLSNAPTGVKIEDDDDPATTLTFTTSKLIKIATITALATTFATYGYVSESKKLSLSSSELGHRQYQKGGDADDFSRKPSSSYSKSARLGRWSSSRDDDEDDDRYSSRRSSSRGRDDFDDDRRGRGNYYAKYRDEDDDEYEKRGRGQRRDLGKDEDEDKYYSKNKHSSSKYDDDDENDHHRKSSEDDEEGDQEEEDPAMKENCVGEAADEEKGIYQYPDKICLTNPSLTPACLGNGGAVTACRFCQTEEAVRKVAGWPQCPHSVCEKSSGIGCIGDSFSKNEISWRMHVKDIAKHNARVKQIGISGTCDSTVSDQAVGRHMFRDKKCSERLLPGCQDAQGCRFCVTKSGAKLDTEKVTAQWPTCPAAVCARFSLEKTDCEATLGLYTVPTFEVPEGFDGSNLPKPKLDLEATQKMQERLKLQIKAAMTGQDDPVFED